MAESEDTTSLTTAAKNETSAESDKGQTRTSVGRGVRGDRGNARNKTRDFSTSTSKYYRGDIEAFGNVFTLKYEKVELNKSFDVFREKLIIYTIKELNNSEYVIMLLQDTEDPNASFNTKNEPKYLIEAEYKSEVKKDVLAARVRQYIER